MKLSAQDKFFIKDDDGALVLVTEIVLNEDMIKNNFLTMKGVLFYIDYDSNKIDEGRVPAEVTVSFNIENIHEVYPE